MVSLFEGWLIENFPEHADSCRPLILLLDGDSNQYQPDIIHQVKDNAVIYNAVFNPRQYMRPHC